MTTTTPAAQFHPYPKTLRFDDAAETKKKNAKDNHAKVSTFVGTVKLHGTNSSIVVESKTKKWYAQSRNRVLDEKSDNQGWHKWLASKTLDELFDAITTSAKTQLGLESTTPSAVMSASTSTTTTSSTTPSTTVGVKQSNASTSACANNGEQSTFTFVVFGEFCGPKIQNCVAISKLEHSFTIFAVRIVPVGSGDSTWLRLDRFSNVLRDHSQHIYNIYEYPTFSVALDWANPSSALQQMQAYSDQVGKECPVSKLRSGVKNGLGEGIVWSERGVCNAASASSTLDTKSSSAASVSGASASDALSMPSGDTWLRFAFKTKSALYTEIVDGKKKDASAGVSDGKVVRCTTLAQFLKKVCTTQKYTEAFKYATEKVGKYSENPEKHQEAFSSWFAEDVYKEESLSCPKGIDEAQAEQELLKRANHMWKNFCIKSSKLG